MRLSFTSDAEQDLADIAAFSLERWNEPQATRYVESLIAQCELLCHFPLLGYAVKSRLKGLRRYVFRQHVVLYLPQKHEVRVLRVLHHRRRESKGNLVSPK